MKKFLAKIYGLYAGIIFFALTIIMVIVFFIIKILPIKDRDKMLNLFGFTNFMLAIWGFFTQIKMKKEGWEKLDPNGQYVFTPNHVNMLDITLFGRHFKFYARPLAKKEITKIPFFGALFSLTSILVDREDRTSRTNSLKTMQLAMDKGMSIVIFPEGTRNRTEKPLREFHSGGFRLAIAQQVPIVPIVQLNLRSMQPVNTWELYPGTIIMRVLDPIPTTGLTENDVKMLSEKVKNIIQAELEKEDNFWKAK